MSEEAAVANPRDFARFDERGIAALSDPSDPLRWFMPLDSAQDLEPFECAPPITHLIRAERAPDALIGCVESGLKHIHLADSATVCTRRKMCQVIALLRPTVSKCAARRSDFKIHRGVW